MNFFGHALIAQRDEATRGPTRAEFVLGSMLPDFASMLRTRPPAATLDTLRAGISFHHRTDDAFHGSQSFLDFSRQASSFLGDRGVSRGTARAVGHVGVELLLDAAFAREEHANHAYLSAVACASSERVRNGIHWQTKDDHERFQQLCQNLWRRGPFQENPGSELVVERLRNILADRPRLALAPGALSVVGEWVSHAQPRISSGAPQLLREVEQRLRGDFPTRAESRDR
jgi:acyl carrier protein phosphodiesterase